MTIILKIPKLTVLTAIVATLFTVPSFGQNKYRARYHGEVNVGGLMGINKNLGTFLNFQTVHGVEYADGAFVGAGIGAVTELSHEMLVPLYVKAAQNFFTKHTMQPYFGFSLGAYTNDNLVFKIYYS